MKMSTMVKQLEKHRDRISKERDALRVFVSDAGELLESVDEALDLIDNAIDALSQQA